jgi:hypothetical protein
MASWWGEHVAWLCMEHCYMCMPNGMWVFWRLFKNDSWGACPEFYGDLFEGSMDAWKHLGAIPPLQTSNHTIPYVLEDSFFNVIGVYVTVNVICCLQYLVYAANKTVWACADIDCCRCSFPQVKRQILYSGMTSQATSDLNLMTLKKMKNRKE